MLKICYKDIDIDNKLLNKIEDGDVKNVYDASQSVILLANIADTTLLTSPKINSRVCILVSFVKGFIDSMFLKSSFVSFG